MSNLTKTLIFFTIFLTLAMVLSSTPTQENLIDTEDDAAIPELQRGVGLFLSQQSKGLKKCNKNPRLCHAKSSHGPDCCNKKCVNVMTNEQNCGFCGRKCEDIEICCKGSCVNPMRSKHNCGECNYVCEKGDSCVHGMCSYE
ncbi:hypothetical protein OSB04_002669 [Centaurea solstitialis]|uniref:Stigma-specific STIG1-like protein 1 n=1 Tax=Centaurea solstitialis TaxID=347529 RepID=A0AA38U0X9_9ASTR|nr:hypothetical protein OSB04_002669 [Centaurea solstitialis]